MGKLPYKNMRILKRKKKHMILYVHNTYASFFQDITAPERCLQIVFSNISRTEIFDISSDHLLIYGYLPVFLLKSDQLRTDI